MDLRANTAVDVLIGPFVDGTNGKDTEEGESPVVLLSKNGQGLAGKNEGTTPAHDNAGYYNCMLDVTDTNTESQLVLVVEDSANALPVRHEYNVLSEAAWDSLYVAKDDGFMDVNIKTIGKSDTTETEADNLEAAFAAAAGAAGGVFIAGTNAATTVTTSFTTTFTGNLTGSVASVTGNVDGNVTGEVGSLGTTAKSDVQTEVDAALASINLDHFVGTASGIPALPAGTYLDLLQDDGTATYSRTSDSLQAIRDHIGNGTNLTEAGGTGDQLTAIPTQDANVIEWLGTAAATPSVAGVPEVDITHVAGATTNVSALATNVDAIKTKTDFLPSATAGAAGGVFIAGTNAATVVTTSFTTTFTGNLTGSVASVTGNVDGNVTGSVGSLAAQAKLDVNAEVDTAISTTTIAELGVGIPVTTPTLTSAVMLVYMALRNKLDVNTDSPDLMEVHNDAGTIIATKTLTDDGSDYSEAKMASG